MFWLSNIGLSATSFVSDKKIICTTTLLDKVKINEEIKLKPKPNNKIPWNTMVCVYKISALKLMKKGKQQSVVIMIQVNCKCETFQMCSALLLFWHCRWSVSERGKSSSVFRWKKLEKLHPGLTYTSYLRKIINGYVGCISLFWLLSSGNLLWNPKSKKVSHLI